MYKKLTFSILLLAFAIYTGFVYIRGAGNVTATMNPDAIKGKLLWQKNNCAACHQIYGLGGYLGPDLTNVIKIKGRDYAGAMMKTGIRTMPKFNFSDAETNAILEYLEHINETGLFPDTNVKFNRYGSFHVPTK